MFGESQLFTLCFFYRLLYSLDFVVRTDYKSMPPELDFAAMTSDIIIKGNLRKAKNWNKRYFVLRDTCPAKLEYYENERRYKSNNSKPKRTISLERPWNIAKKKDIKHDYLIVIFTEDECFSVAADTAELQDSWFNALQKVVKQGKKLLLIF